MARDRATPAFCEERGTATRLADARDHQRHLLCDAIWLPVVPAAKRFAAVEYDLSLVCEVPRRRSLREDQSRIGHARSRTRRTTGQPHWGDHRQPECQDNRGRWASWLRCREND